MVPAGMLGAPTQSQPVPSGPVVFPPWTRDDEDEDKIRHVELKRHWNTKRDSSPAARGSDSKSRPSVKTGDSENHGYGLSTTADDSDDSDDSDDDQQEHSAGSSPDSKQAPDPLGLPSPKSRPTPLPMPKNKLDTTPTRTIDPTLGPLTTLGKGLLPGAVNKADDDDSDNRDEHNEQDNFDKIDEHDEHDEPFFFTNNPNSPPQSPRFPDIGASYPIVTMPAALDPSHDGFSFPESTAERKGLQPVVTVTESASSSRTPAAADSMQTPDHEVVQAPAHHHGLDADAEKALVAVGAVGATIIVFFVAWFGWKCYKMHRRSGQSKDWQHHHTPSMSLDNIGQPGGTSRRSGFLGLERPKQFMMNLASRVPILKERVAMRSWSNLDKQHDDAVWAEKRLPVFSQDSHRRNSNGITVHTAIMTKSERGNESTTWSLPHQAPSQQFRPTPRSNNTLSGISDASSLSSGFGDGDIIMPPAVTGMATTTTVTAVAVPAPVARRSSLSTASRNYRDTVYTEATEATEASEDTVPRFRTINSWVRQQSGRIKRARQRDSDAPPLPNPPPEQDFRMMMPDNEEPRRVVESGYGVAESDIIAGYGATEAASQSGYGVVETDRPRGYGIAG